MGHRRFWLRNLAFALALSAPLAAVAEAPARFNSERPTARID